MDGCNLAHRHEAAVHPTMLFDITFCSPEEDWIANTHFCVVMCSWHAPVHVVEVAEISVDVRLQPTVRFGAHAAWLLVKRELRRDMPNQWDRR